MPLPLCRPLAVLSLIAAQAIAGAALAKDDPLAGGWVLQPEGSYLGFQSVKNGAKVEMNSMATFSGGISPDGLGEVHVALDSIDTHIDLRNVRMRFLFFETFKYPEAVVTVHIDPAMLSDLAVRRRMVVNLPFTLDLHGVKLDMTADVVVTLISDDLVSVSSLGVIPVAAADFGLTDNVAKLEAAANVKLVPTGSVTFDWVFARGGVQADTAVGAATAKETQGNFDPAACKDRFDTLSHAGNITFNSASARLDVADSAVLDTLLDVVTRCPDMGIEIAGYTDDVGPSAANQTLSQRRADAVKAYLVGKSIDPARLTAKGYGEAEPVVPNDTAENRARNRRIEFRVQN